MIDKATLTRISSGKVGRQGLASTGIVVLLKLGWGLAFGTDMVGGDEGIDLGDVLIALREKSAVFLVAAVGAGNLLGRAVPTWVVGVGSIIGIGFGRVGEGGGER